MVFEATQDFNASFHVGGVLLFIAGLFFCTLHLPFFRRQIKEKHDAEMMACDVPDFPEDLHLFDELDPGPMGAAAALVESPVGTPVGPGGDAAFKPTAHQEPVAL
jgi:hypothetical protein